MWARQEGLSTVMQKLDRLMHSFVREVIRIIEMPVTVIASAAQISFRLLHITLYYFLSLLSHSATSAFINKLLFFIPVWS
jgi:hypothetical protein